MTVVNLHRASALTHFRSRKRITASLLLLLSLTRVSSGHHFSSRLSCFPPFQQPAFFVTLRNLPLARTSSTSPAFINYGSGKSFPFTTALKKADHMQNLDESPYPGFEEDVEEYRRQHGILDAEEQE